MTDDDLKRQFDAMRQENAAAHAETRRDFNETANRLAAENRHFFEIATDATRHEIGLIAEKVTRLDEKLDNLDEKIERTAAETQAMMKFSHAELDRRMRTLEGTQRTLEESLADLQARVERIESSTH